MRSIFFKILVWFAGTVLICLVGLTLTNEMRMRFTPGHHDFFSRALTLQVTDAAEAYETAGKPALRQYFDRLNALFPGRHILVDQNGIDLLTGQDRTGELKKIGPHWSPGSESRMTLVWPSRDNKYRMVIDAPSPPGPWSPIPYYLWIALAAVCFCYILAVQLASPLRKLEQTVEKFGRGDLAVRASVTGRDEIGRLGQAFNVMADRIESLLNAERRLLMDVSHELRSPLARLKFAVELARGSRDRDKSIDRIEKEIDRLTILVSELLQVTKAENDPESRNVEPVRLADLVRDVVEDSTVESHAYGCQLRIVEADGSVVPGDRELLRRAIENIVRNGIRYAPSQTDVEIAVRRHRDLAVVSIRDYGPGVPESALQSLFKPFFRVEADRNRTATGGGVGLGLSIAERAVSVHEGRIRARNADPGLYVEIELPVIAAPAAKEAGIEV